MEDVLKNVQLITAGDQVKHEGNYYTVKKILVEPQFNKVWVAMSYQDNYTQIVFTLNDTVWVKQS